MASIFDKAHVGKVAFPHLCVGIATFYQGMQRKHKNLDSCPARIIFGLN